MKQAGKAAGAGRVLNAVAMATFWLAGTATGFAAEPTASDNARVVPGASRTESNLPSIYSYRAADIASLRQGFAAPPRESSCR
jgi:hypothetical protein